MSDGETQKPSLGATWAMRLRRPLSVVAIVVVGTLVCWAGWRSGVGAAIPQAGAAMVSFPWIRAALVDFMLMATFVSLWIVGRERNPVLAVLCVAGLWVFGSAFLGAYVLWRLRRA